jgi:hypothetical protein
MVCGHPMRVSNCWSADGTGSRCWTGWLSGADLGAGAAEWVVAVDVAVIRARPHGARARHGPPGSGRGGVGAGGPVRGLNRMTRNPSSRQSRTRKLQAEQRIGRRWVVPEAGTAAMVHIGRGHPLPAGGAGGPTCESSVRVGVAGRPARTGSWRTRPSSVAIRTAPCTRYIKAPIPGKEDEITGRAHRGSKGGHRRRQGGLQDHRASSRPPCNKLRQTRAVATRCEKREFVSCGTIDVASIRIWLRDAPDTYSPDAAWLRARCLRRPPGSRCPEAAPTSSLVQ